jgi:molecular chaperone DnaK
VSIVQAEAGVFEVLSSHGDTQLGGDDFDDLLMNHIADEFVKLFQVDLRENVTSKARLLRAAENAKKHLSDHPFARIEEEFIAEKDGVPLHLNIEVARDDFEELIAPLISRTMDCVQKALDDAKITAAQVQRVVLVGGSTRTPMIARLLEQRLNQPAHKEVHPDLCVALGAAVQAAIIAGENVGAVLVDITPHTLGIKCLEYPTSFLSHPNEFKFAPIVPRNTPLPTSRSEAFCTVSDNQPSVDIEVFQGESGDVRRNHRIGKFLIEGLARVPAGNQLVVELNLTLDGTLKVSAREKATGLVKQITIENAMARFAVEERDAAKERLDRLWADPEYDAGEEGDEEETEGTRVGDLLDEADEYFRDEADDDEDAPAFGDGEDDGPFENVPTAPPRVTVPEPAPVVAATNEPGLRESAQAAQLLVKADKIRGKASAEDQAEVDKLTTRVKSALDEKRWPDLQSACNELANVLFYLE